MSTIPLHPVARLPIIADVGPSVLAGPSTHGGHELGAIQTCPLYWWYRYVQDIRPRAEPSYRLLGTLIHVCLAYYYVSTLPGEARPSWFSDMDLHRKLRLLAGAQVKLVDQALCVFPAYIDYYADEATHPEWPMRPVWIEHEFGATVGELDPGGPDPTLDGITVTARYDNVMEAKNGDLYIDDYKCQGRGRKDGRLESWKDQGEYVIDPQVLQGLAILRKRVKNRFVAGFRIKRIKREAPFDFDTSPPLAVPERAYRSIGRYIRAQVAAEREWSRRLEAGADPVRDPAWWNLSACKGTRYGPCDYRPLCAAPDGEYDFVLSGRFIRLEEILGDDDTSYID